MRHTIALVFVTAALAMLAAHSYAGDPQHLESVEGEHFRVRAYSQQQSPTINRMHAWVLHLEDLSGVNVQGATISISGGMPKHDHGLPTEPQVTQYLGDGQYSIEGMKFHMSGLWHIEFTIVANGNRDTIIWAVTL